MAKINEIDITSLTFQEGSAPATPASTKWKVYAKTDGLYYIDDAGVETGPLSTGGGGGGSAPEWVEYLNARQADETADGDDDFFTDATKTGYTETTVAGTATWTELRDRMSLKASGGTTGDAATLLKSITASGPPLSIETAMIPTIFGADFATYGLCFTDGTTASDNIVSVGALDRGNTTDNLQVNSGTLTDFANTNHVTTIAPSFYTHKIYLRLVWTASNTFAASYSSDGISWHDFNLAPFSFTMTPTHFGLFGAQFNSSTQPLIATWEYLRMNESNLDV